jgi:hypothetical protein
MDVTAVLGIVVVVLLVLAAFGVNAGKVSLGWLGLAVWALTVLVLR